MFETQLIGADNVAIRRITPHLRLVFWEMTVGCNLNCIHCRRLETAHELMREDLSTSEAYRLIDGITEVGKPVLVLSGGEPLLRSDVFEIARYATERQLIVCLATNATLIDARTARMLQDAGIKRCAVSLDGADADTHDTFRAQPGSFDRALTGIRYLREAGVEVQINMTLTRYTAPHMQSVYELARNVGAIAFHVFLLVPVGCGAEIADEQMLTAQECEALLNELYELAQRGELQVKATCAPQFYRIINQRGIKTHRHHHIKSDEVEGRTSVAISAMSRITRGCLAGSSVCFISHKGEVFPCGYLPIKAGDVREQPFSEIWYNSPVFVTLRMPALLTGKCGRCEYRMICYGCRARAYYATGDMMSEEPLCVYQPKSMRSGAHQSP